MKTLTLAIALCLSDSLLGKMQGIEVLELKDRDTDFGPIWGTPPKSKTYGPERKGKRGKVKRW